MNTFCRYCGQQTARGVSRRHHRPGFVCGAVRSIFETATTQPFPKIYKNSTTCCPLAMSHRHELSPALLSLFAPIGAFAIHVFLSSFPSPRLPAWNNTALTGRIFMKFDISVFAEIFLENIALSNVTRITDTLLYLKTSVHF